MASKPGATKPKKSFGKRMRALRQKAEMSIEALAGDTGCSAQRLLNIEADKVLPHGFRGHKDLQKPCVWIQDRFLSAEQKGIP